MGVLCWYDRLKKLSRIVVKPSGSDCSRLRELHFRFFLLCQSRFLRSKSVTLRSSLLRTWRSRLSLNRWFGVYVALQRQFWRSMLVLVRKTKVYAREQNEFCQPGFFSRQSWGRRKKKSRDTPSSCGPRWLKSAKSGLLPIGTYNFNRKSIR